MDAVVAFFHRTLAVPSKRNDVSYKIRYSTLFWLFLLGSVVGERMVHFLNITKMELFQQCRGMPRSG